MVRTDYVIEMIDSYRKGNDEKFLKSVESAIAEEESKGNKFVANRLRQVLRGVPTLHFSSFGESSNSVVFPDKNSPEGNLFEIIYPDEIADEIVLSSDIEKSLRALIKEVSNRKKLTKWGFPYFGRILFCGPAGTGKTTLARYITRELNLRMIYVRLDTMISSYLGQTGSNVRIIFEYAKKNKVILFIDEFDAIAKMRDDNHELGELKRVVNTLIQNIDNFKTTSLLIAATNHPHLLDSAIWRRFDEVLWFDLPNSQEREEIFKLHTKKIPKQEINYSKLSKFSEGFSGADIVDAIRHAVRLILVNDKERLTEEDLISAILLISKNRKEKELSFSKNINQKSYKLKDLNNIKEYCHELRESGYKITEIAEMVGMSKSSVSRYLKEGEIE